MCGLPALPGALSSRLCSMDWSSVEQRAGSFDHLRQRTLLRFSDDINLFGYSSHDISPGRYFGIHARSNGDVCLRPKPSARPSSLLFAICFIALCTYFTLPRWALRNLPEALLARYLAPSVHRLMNSCRRTLPVWHDGFAREIVRQSPGQPLIFLLFCVRSKIQAFPCFPVTRADKEGFVKLREETSYTQEQLAVISMEPSPVGICKVNLRPAGTGKTTTLAAYARARPSRRFLYIVFNVSVREDAKSKFPRH